MAGYQSNRASCGPAALANALEALGIKRTEAELITLTGQTPDGTSPKQLLKALKAIGAADKSVTGEIFKASNSSAATIGLWHCLVERGRPVILCVDSHEHWVAAVGYVGPRFVILDSAEVGLVFYYTDDELAERWIGPKGGYYGVVV